MLTVGEPQAALGTLLSASQSELRRRLLGIALTPLAWLAAINPAHATLGGANESVERDRAHMAARISTTQVGSYQVHTLILPNHGVVKEFARPDGTVFAIAWRGPGRPDLRQLLGSGYDQMQAENRPPNGRRTFRPLSVNRSDLVVQSAGHPGAFSGFALLPMVQPSDFSISDLRVGAKP
jgi:hypothetical protein